MTQKRGLKVGKNKQAFTPFFPFSVLTPLYRKKLYFFFAEVVQIG
jgi:hypothetical protein